MELLLIPGLLCDDSLWAEQVKVLEGEVNITIPDHKSHDDMAALAADILSKAPPKFALAGLSMGGYISLEIMRQAPERVSKLALLDTAPYADTEEQTVFRHQMMDEAKKSGKASIMSIFPMMIYEERIEDQELIDALVAMDENNSVRSYFNQQKAIMSRQNSVPLLSEISCPTLVLCGRYDLLTPLSAHEEMAEKIPGATLVVLEKCGHMSTMERPEEVNQALLKWLKG
ncbi:MAG: alpha/beta hydrolase [Rhodospirillales bacterium]|nr:alpha/beta hydrolase [Rhodospirillales bacterium]